MNINANIKSFPTLFVQAALISTGVILALVLVTKYVAPIPLSVNQVTTQKETSFNVTGKSTVTTTPDKVEVTIGISDKEADLKQAQSKANDIINKITDQLVGLGIKKEDIKTQNYSINPNFDYQRTGQNIVGYSVDTSLNVSFTDFSKLNQVIDLSTAAGANQVNGIQFTLSDAKQKDLKQQARSQAIEDAKNNAAQLSRLSGMRLSRIINISEGEDRPGPIPYLTKSFASVDSMNAGGGIGGGAPTNVQPGSTDYNYTVTLSYETL
jgi:uncharacterized protein YggE